ncbi:MAG: tRNA pseudouridine(38-40) synthase TruA [Niabella sp.]
MPRYFLEVSYKGTLYKGFQLQPNAKTIQGEIEAAFTILFGKNKAATNFFSVSNAGWLSCSSRTDAGVHAVQNFFHFDSNSVFKPDWIYNLNAILPSDIVIESIKPVADEAHSRFDAKSRLYHYRIYNSKNAFLQETAYFYPYPLDFDKLNEAAGLLKTFSDFTSFSKRNTQVKTFQCTILESRWIKKEDVLIYEVRANRFLRGMVRALTATMLKVGRGKISVAAFKEIIEAKDCTHAFFDTPAHGLFLMEVEF